MVSIWCLPFPCTIYSNMKFLKFHALQEIQVEVFKAFYVNNKKSCLFWLPNTFFSLSFLLFFPSFWLDCHFTYVCCIRCLMVFDSYDKNSIEELMFDEFRKAAFGWWDSKGKEMMTWKWKWFLHIIMVIIRLSM